MTNRTYLKRRNSNQTNCWANWLLRSLTEGPSRTRAVSLAANPGNRLLAVTRIDDDRNQASLTQPECIV